MPALCEKIAGMDPFIEYHYNPGQILPHFYVKNIFLAQILAELEHFHWRPSWNKSMWPHDMVHCGGGGGRIFFRVTFHSNYLNYFFEAKNGFSINKHNIAFVAEKGQYLYLKSNFWLLKKIKYFGFFQKSQKFRFLS